MSSHQAKECTDCGEFSRTGHKGPSGPVCERCYEWNLKAEQLIPATHDGWGGRKTPVFAKSQEASVA